MKRLLLIIASSVVLLAGCTKENVTLSNNDGELQSVTFTTALENGVTTKAVADGDGAADSVNRCIMEVYYCDSLFTRMYAPVIEKKASFTIQVVSNRTYKVAFWADHIDVPSGENLATDKYYDTSNGLKAISLKETYVGNKDARDAFALCKEYTVEQGGSTFAAALKRPFAQINVITTDVATVKKVSTLVPEGVDVTLKNAAVKYNVLDSTAVSGQVADLKYAASVYNWGETKAECTLSMDYVFAEKEKAVIDIEWKATKSGDSPVAHTFAAVPYQRNYRTNIKGALLTTTGQWNVTVDPIWDKLTGDKDIEVFYEQVSTGSDVKGALDGKNGDSSQDGKGAHISIDQGKGTTDVNDDIIIPDNTPKDKTPEIILDFQTLVAGSQIIIRDENHERTAAEASSGAKEYDGEIIVVVPEGTTANQVKILTNKSTVTVRGQYGTVIASCAPQTIIVEAGTVIGKLEVMKGNVEVYGEVTSIENKTSAQEADKSVVYVYLCQGSVWTNVAKEKNDKLVPLYPVAKIGETFYFSIPEAIAAVNDGEIVSMISDVTLSEKLLISNGKEFTFDLGGNTLTGRVNVSGAKLTVKNGTIDSGSFAQALNAYGTRDLAYVGNLFTYVKVESDVTLKGVYGMCFLSNIADGYYPEAYGVKVDFYGKSECVSPSYVSGNIGYDNYVANLGSGYTPNLPAGISAPSKAMKLYGPEFNVYGTLGSNGASQDESPQGISLSGMIRVNVYEGASITGDEAIGMKSGLVNVFGGTLTSVGAKIDPVQAVSSGTEASGAAISITSFYTYDIFADRATMEVNISGGTIQSTNNSALLVSHSYSGGQPVALKQGVDLSISGGSFIGGTGVPVVFIDNAATGDAFAMPCNFITGGQFSSEPASDYITSGCKSALNSTSGYYEIVESDDWIDFVKSQPESYVMDKGNKTISLGSREALIWFAKQTQTDQNQFVGYTAILGTDVDLSGYYWTPIQAWHTLLVFDGGNHTVSNMMTRIVGDSKNYRSFFGHITADIQNITMTGANVAAYAYTGIVAGDTYGNLENVHVSNSTVNGSYWGIGGITGFHDGGNMTNCSAKDITITAGCPGGLVGVYNETANRTYENCTATNCTLNDIACWGAPYTYGSIVAVVNIGGLTMKKCSSSGMTYYFDKTQTTYHSGDEGKPGAPVHSLYGSNGEDPEYYTVIVINE